MATEVERIELVITTDNKAAIKALKQMQKDLGGTGKQAKKTGTILTAMAARSSLAAGAIKKTAAAAAFAAPAFAAVAVAGKAMIAVLGIGAAAFLLLGVSAIKGSIDSQKALTEVATLADFTTKELDQMRQGTRLLAIQFGQSFKTISAARFDVVSSGFADVREQQELLSKGFKLGVANATDVSVATKLLTGTLKAFKLPASEATRVMDELTIIAGGSKTNLEGLAGAIAKVAPSARRTGQTLSTVGATLDIMTLASISADEAATQVKSALRSLANPAIVKTLDDMGVKVKEGPNKEFRNFRDILVDINELSPDQIFKAFPSEEAQSAIGVLTDNLGAFSDQIDVLASKDIAGATEARFQEVENTLAFQLDRLSQAWTASLTSTVDEGIVGALTRAAKTVADFVQDGFDEIKVLQRQVGDLLDREQELMRASQATGVRKFAAERAKIELEANRQLQEELQQQIKDIGQRGRDEEEAEIVADVKETTEKKEKAIAEETLAKRKQLNTQIRQLELQSTIAGTDDVVEQERLKWAEVIRQAEENLATREQLVRLNALAEAAIARKSAAEAEKLAKEAGQKSGKAIDARISLREKIAKREEEIQARSASKSEKIFTEEAAKEDEIVREADAAFIRGQLTKAQLNEILIASEERLRDIVAERIEAEAPEDELEDIDPEGFGTFTPQIRGIDELLNKLPLLEENLASTIPRQQAMRAAADAAGAALVDQAVAGKFSAKALGQAAKQAAVQVLKSKAAEAAGLAIFETASGLAALALSIFPPNPAAAAAAQGHFAAAASFATVAGVSAGAAAAIGGGGGGGGGGGAQDDVTRAQRRKRDADLDERLGTGGQGVTIINNITGVANRAQMAAIADQNADAARVQFDGQLITQNLGTVAGQ